MVGRSFCPRGNPVIFISLSWYSQIRCSFEVNTGGYIHLIKLKKKLTFELFSTSILVNAMHVQVPLLVQCLSFGSPDEHVSYIYASVLFFVT